MNRVPVNGIEMAFDDAGSGAPVVLLHGFPFDRTMWRDQVDALKGSYRVITPDLRGLGETGMSGAESAMTDMAADVAALLDSLNIDRVVIGGLSMGGYVALAFYRLFPLRVRGLILADTKSQADTDEAREIRRQQAETALKEGMKPIVDRMLPRILSPGTLAENSEVVSRLQKMMLSQPPRGAAAALLGMASRKDCTLLLPQIPAPTLIIVGEEDEITPSTDAELMHREIRGSRLVVIDGAAHVSNVEMPERFNTALLEFLDTLQP
jgi:3-oxoadipate enol-lactonase